jgi:hypothetical protein
LSRSLLADSDIHVPSGAVITPYLGSRAVIGTAEVQGSSARRLPART